MQKKYYAQSNNDYTEYWSYNNRHKDCCISNKSQVIVMSPLPQRILKSNFYFDTPTRIYTFLNPVSYLDALDNKELYTKFDGIFADGSMLVAAIRMLYWEKVVRRSFDMTSIAPELFDYALKNNKSIYIVASKQEQVEKAVEIFKEKWNGLNVIGFRNGYFDSEEEKEHEARHIAEVNPDFLIVGMGAVMQEKFLVMVKENGFKGIGFTCGGFVHQVAKGDMDYYPAWVDKWNLRFIYRFFKEQHTRRRYLKAAFVFPARFFIERFFG